MAKRKKKRTLRRRKGGSGSGGRWLEKQLAKVKALQEGEAYQEAFELLLTLLERYPRDPGVLDRLIDVAAQMNNWRAVLTYSERLYPMQRGDERAVTLNNLMAASIKLRLPALAWQSGSILLADHPEFKLSLDVKKFVQKIEPVLFNTFRPLNLVSERFDGDRAKILAFMVEHDWMRFFTQSAQTQETIVRSRRLLAEVPEFIPALNNISWAYFREGDIERAIEATQQVLALQPGNHHALSDLVRYSFLMGETDAAWQHAMVLKSLVRKSPKVLLKYAEAFAYLGDDEAVRAAYLQAEPHQWLKSPILLHLGAAAHYRLGYQSKAWALWEEALRIDPSFYMAQASLADRAKAPHERNVGWYWPLGYWFPGNFKASLEKLQPSTLVPEPVEGRPFDRLRASQAVPEPVEGQGSASGTEADSNRAAKQAVEKLLKQYPQLPALAPHILDRGDPAARQILLPLIEAAAIPDLSQALLAYGLSPHGPDAQRIKGLQFLAKSHPDLLPADRKLPVWHQGEQKEILLLSFHIHSEPEEAILDDETYDLFLKGHTYLKYTRDLKRAERSFIEIINAYPDFPAAYNQLARVYELQGRHKEMKAVLEETHLRFPDDPLARTTLARLYLQQKRIDEARALLNPILQQKRLHVTELRALAQAEIMLALTTERTESAPAWLDMWQKVEPAHPDIAKWKARIEQKSSSVRKRSTGRHK